MIQKKTTTDEGEVNKNYKIQQQTVAEKPGDREISKECKR
jgi:hypothetical protein